MGKIVTLMSDKFVVQEEHFNKDVYLAGEYLAQNKGYEYELVCATSTMKTGEYEGKKFINIGKVVEKSNSIEFYNLKHSFRILKKIKMYLKENAKNIDILVLFHPIINTAINAKLYKKYNPNGKVYVKLDSACRGDANRGIKKIIRKCYYHPMMLKYVDVFSAETVKTVDDIKANGFFGLKMYNKLVYLPNGISNDIVACKVKSFEQKENLIITVGRIGAYEKNNEMFINALKNVDLKDWKVKLIGPYNSSFKDYLKKVMDGNSNLIGKVELLGAIYDKSLLYEYYNKAKCFVLTSRFEGFPIVFGEALGFNDYIISTNVGGALDITNNNTIGKVIECNNEGMLINEINALIHEDAFNIKVYDEISNFKKCFYFSDLISVVSEKL